MQTKEVEPEWVQIWSDSIVEGARVGRSTISVFAEKWKKKVEGSFVENLQAIYRNDKTRYQHHEDRPWDGLRPGESVFGGSIWLTPRELAGRMLVSLGAEIPESIAETVSKKFRKK